MSAAFFFLTCLLVLVCLYPIALVYLGEEDSLSVRFIFALFSLYIYAYMPLYLWFSGSACLTEGMFVKGELAALLVVGSFILGTGRLSSEAARAKKDYDYPISFSKLWWIGLLFIVIGLIGWTVFVNLSGGFKVFYSSPHGRAGAWRETSAYLYGLFSFIFVGLILLRFAGSNGIYVLSTRVISLALLAGLAVHAFTMGSRGKTYLLLAVFLFAPAWFSGKRANPLRVTIVLLFFGVCALVFMHARHYFVIGGNPRKGMEEGIGKIFEVQDSPWNEFVYHCSVIETVEKTGKLDWGKILLRRYLGAVFPRKIFPNKDELIEYLAPDTGIQPIDVFRATGNFIPGLRAVPRPYPGYAASLFMQFGWLSVIFSYLLGLLVRYSFRRAGVSLYAAFFYVFLLMVQAHFVTQGITPIPVQSMYFLFPMWLAVSLAKDRETPRRVS